MTAPILPHLASLVRISLLPSQLRAIAVAAAVAAPVLAIAPPAGALPEPAQLAAPTKPLDGAIEIVVFETDDCLYCRLFRRHIVPAYEASPRARDVPLRFVDVDAPAAGEVSLDAPVDSLPTTVVLHNNHEIGRIPGYVAPETFFHAVSHLMARLD